MPVNGYGALDVSEYEVEIFEHSKRMEIVTMPKSNYIEIQSDLTWDMRSELVNWLVEVHCKLRLLPETLYYAVNVVDRFLSTKAIPVTKLLLVGVTSLFIACKYEEVQIPAVAVMAYMVNNAHNVDEIIKAERYVLHMLQFDLGYPGPLMFLRRISRADRYEPHARLLAKYLLEATLVDEQFLEVKPSYLAASAMYLSRKLLADREWCKMHVELSGYTEEEIFPCAKLIFQLVANPVRLPNVLKKYSDSQYSQVALFVESLVQRMK
ncbi:cyclin-like protein [Chytridium lagenaria]|nr:cyclin-like protein [Chytridium lagenaria]